MARGQTAAIAQPHDREEQTVYVLDGIVQLPHYLKSGIYIAPGYGRWNWTERTEMELILLGARQSIRYLWIRSTT